MEQPVARLAHNQEVAGSSPAPATAGPTDGPSRDADAPAPPVEASASSLRQRAIENLGRIGWTNEELETARGRSRIDREVIRLEFLARVQAPR